MLIIWKDRSIIYLFSNGKWEKNIKIYKLFLFLNEDLRVRRQAFYGRRFRPRVSSGSEYYGQTGTPAYKLRQRNPYGGRWKVLIEKNLTNNCTKVFWSWHYSALVFYAKIIQRVHSIIWEACDTQLSKIYAKVLRVDKALSGISTGLLIKNQRTSV